MLAMIAGNVPYSQGAVMPQLMTAAVAKRRGSAELCAADESCRVRLQACKCSTASPHAVLLAVPWRCRLVLAKPEIVASAASGRLHNKRGCSPGAAQVPKCPPECRA